MWGTRYWAQVLNLRCVVPALTVFTVWGKTSRTQDFMGTKIWWSKAHLCRAKTVNHNSLFYPLTSSICNLQVWVPRAEAWVGVGVCPAFHSSRSIIQKAENHDLWEDSCQCKVYASALPLPLPPLFNDLSFPFPMRSRLENFSAPRIICPQEALTDMIIKC